MRAGDVVLEDLEREGELTLLEGGDNFHEGLVGERTFREGGR